MANGLKKFLKASGFLIKIVLSAALIILVIGVIGYKTGHSGIDFTIFEDYRVLTVSFKKMMKTYTFGSFPESDNISLDLKHKKGDLYYSLNVDEQIVYDSILTRCYQIINEGETDTEIRIPIRYMTFDGIEDCKNFEEVKSLVDASLRDMDYDGIYQALHKDYDYLMWWEYDMEWQVAGANLTYDNGDFKDSSFRLIVKPVDCYAVNNSTISDTAIDEVRKAYNLAKRIVEECPYTNKTDRLNYFKNIICENLSYNESIVEDMMSGSSDEVIVLARNFMSAFDNNSSTNAVCSGYAVAFQLLCDLDGIECYKQNGKMENNDISVSHSWNVINLDGQKYFADITNSDSGTVGQDGTLFLKPINSYKYSFTFYDRKYTYVED